MKMANGVGQIQNFIEDSQPLWSPVVYHATYTGGGFVVGNGLAALLTKDEDKKPDNSLTFFGKRAIYLSLAGTGTVVGNGLPRTTMETIQAGGLFLGTASLAFWREGLVTGQGKIDKALFYTGVSSLGLASMVYAIRKFRGL